MNTAIACIGFVVLTVLVAALAPVFSPALHEHQTAHAFPDQRKYWLTSPTDGDSRRNLFAPGTRYRVKTDLAQGRGRFLIGELLTFARADYSRTDSAMVYCFQRSDGSAVDWWLPDCEPPENVQRIFEPLLEVVARR